MQVGSLVRYNEHHRSLNEVDMVGVVLEVRTFLYLAKAYVKWNATRPQGDTMWDYVDELEVINEGGRPSSIS